MLQNMREKLSGPVSIAVLGLIAVAFIFWGIDFGFFNRDFVAKVNGEEIPNSRFSAAYQNQLGELQRYYRDELTPELRSEVRQNTLDGFIRNTVLEQRSRDDGYRVSDAALTEYIRSLPAFQVGGQFSMDAYKATLASNSYSPTRFEEEQRRALAQEQLRQGIISSGFTTTAETRRFVELLEEQRDVAYAIVPADGFRDQVEVSEDEVAAYYDENKDRFMTAESVTLQYVEVNADEVAAAVEVTEDDLLAYYETVKARYSTPERRRPRHILIEFGDDESAAEQRAGELAARAQSGEDFAELAQEYSEDPATSDLGGDLDWLERGVFEGPLEDAIFEMQEGEIRGPVRSDFGFHVLRLDQIEESTGRSFADAREELETEYRDLQSEAAYYERAETLAEKSFESPDELDTVAAALGTAVKQIEGFTRAGGGELAAFPTVAEAAFSTPVLEDNENSRLVELSERRAVVLRVADHRLPEQRSIDEVRAEIESSLALSLARERASEAGQALLEQVRDGGVFADLAAAAGADYQESRAVGRRDSALPAELLAEIFRAAKPGTTPTVAGIELASGDYAIFEISAVRPGDPEGGPRERRLQERDALAQMSGDGSFAAYVTELRRKASVQVFEIEDEQL